MFAELLQRSLDAEFDAEYRENGSFIRKKSKDRDYWHFQWREGEKVRNKYVGPVSDASITDRVKRFSSLKASFKRRQTLVRALAAADLPKPDPLSGRIEEVMWKAGFFQLRGVLGPAELAASWNSAWTAGKQWRQKLESGKARLSSDTQAMLAASVKRK